MKTFRLKSGARGLFWFCGLGGVAMAVGGAAKGDWLFAGLGAASATFMALLPALPRQVEFDDDGLTFGNRRVRFAEATARWSGHGGDGVVGLLVGVASDNWVVTITAPTLTGAITLSGPMFKEQAELRAALEARLGAGPGAS